MTSGMICTRVIATATPNEPVREIAGRMAEHEVGTLLVVEAENDTPVGLVTDRDVTTRCVATGLNPDVTPVSRIMSTPVHVVDEDVSVEDALARMAGAGTRRLVVTQRHRAVGILSLDDCLNLLCREAGSIHRLIEKQQPRVMSVS